MMKFKLLLCLCCALMCSCLIPWIPFRCYYVDKITGEAKSIIKMDDVIISIDLPEQGFNEIFGKDFYTSVEARCADPDNQKEIKICWDSLFLIEHHKKFEANLQIGPERTADIRNACMPFPHDYYKMSSNLLPPNRVVFFNVSHLSSRSAYLMGSAKIYLGDQFLGRSNLLFHWIKEMKKQVVVGV